MHDTIPRFAILVANTIKDIPSALCLLCDDDDKELVLAIARNIRRSAKYDIVKILDMRQFVSEVI